MYLKHYTHGQDHNDPRIQRDHNQLSSQGYSYCLCSEPWEDNESSVQQTTSRFCQVIQHSLTNTISGLQVVWYNCTKIWVRHYSPLHWKGQNLNGWTSSCNLTWMSQYVVVVFHLRPAWPPRVDFHQSLKSGLLARDGIFFSITFFLVWWPIIEPFLFKMV